MDLTTNSGMREYLTATCLLDVDDVIYLPDGLANFTYRVNLRQPYRGCITIIVKYGAPFHASRREVSFNQARLRLEYEALRTVADNKIISLDSLVQIPEVYNYDSANHILIMQDCGDLPSLFWLMANQQLNTEVATKIGNELGNFLAKLHVWGYQNDDLVKNFQNPVHQVTWTILSSYTQPNPEDSGYSFSDAEKQLFADTLKSESEHNANAAKTLIMGDFWCKNILVDFDPVENRLHRIYIVDWEMARYGLPYHDVGCFCPDFHFHSLAKHPLSCDILRSAFLTTYAKVCNPDIKYIKGTAIVLGTWLIVWTPRDALETQENIKLGIEYLLKASMNEYTLLKDSVLKDLVNTDNMDLSNVANNITSGFARNVVVNTALE